MGATSFARDPASPSTPPPPFSPYGTVVVNGAPAAEGTLVGGWCGGTLWDTYAAELFAGEAWYALEIPGDDPETTDVTEGCSSGERVTFTIDGLPAPQSATWFSGDTQVNLTTTFGVEATKQVSSDGETWHDADTSSSGVTVDAGTEVSWRILVTNTSAVTVGLTLTDTVNGSTTLPLSSACDVPPPATLAPMGEDGSSYTCAFDQLANAGATKNVVSATISLEGWSATVSDPAHLFGIARGVEVRKRLWDGSTWHEADTPATYPEVVVDTALTWQISITNTSNVTVSLGVTDTLDWLPLALHDVCTPAPPATMPPLGAPGATYACQVEDSATLGSHRNVITASVAYGDSGASATDAAGYAGIEADWNVYLPLVLRGS